MYSCPQQNCVRNLSMDILHHMKLKPIFTFAINGTFPFFNEGFVISFFNKRRMTNVFGYVFIIYKFFVVVDKKC